jgi:SAM-dependent methyltransferase
MDLDARYDAINTAIFLPSGGSQRLRRQFVGTLDVHADHRVLELGCGTGQVTQALIEAGADVVAVDALPEMLSGARRRAPEAVFVEGDAIDADVGTDFDRVVLSFVLHDFDTDGRRRLLHRAVDALGPHGRIGILDWAVPRRRGFGRAWRWFLARLEPSPNVVQVLDGGIETDLKAVGLGVVDRHRVALDRAQSIVVQPLENVHR